MDLLPLEILDQILHDPLLSTRDLKRLRLVNKRLAKVLLPRLFGQLRFRATVESCRALYLASTSTTVRPHIRKIVYDVRMLYCTNTRIDSSDQLTLQQSFARLPNLNAVEYYTGLQMRGSALSAGSDSRPQRLGSLLQAVKTCGKEIESLTLNAIPYDLITKDRHLWVHMLQHVPDTLRNLDLVLLNSPVTHSAQTSRAYIARLARFMHAPHLETLRLGFGESRLDVSGPTRGHRHFPSDKIQDMVVIYFLSRGKRSKRWPCLRHVELHNISLSDKCLWQMVNAIDDGSLKTLKLHNVVSLSDSTNPTKWMDFFEHVAASENGHNICFSGKLGNLSGVVVTADLPGTSGKELLERLSMK